MSGPQSDELERYTFTDEGPWSIDPDALEWTAGIDVIRSTVRRQVPELTSRRRIPPLRRLATVSAHLGVALGGWALRDRRAGGTRSTAGLSRRLRIAAERLGPTYIKLGQIISSGEGLFPPELVAEFRKCRDQVRAEPWATVREVVEADLGRPIEAVFSSFDRTPIAAASIAQVHAATLRSGEEVVVKVQRPTIRQQVEEDLRVMSWIAPFLIGRIPVAALANPPALVELFAETITEELDFRLEAENMLDVAEVFAQLGQRGFVIARPHPELVTRRILVMERLHGFGFEDLESMQSAGIDTVQVVRTGMSGFTEGCIVHGIFHGDLHGGNLFVLDDGRIALLDFGITARMTPLQRSAFLRLMLCGAMGDIPGQITAFRDLGALPADTDIDDVIRTLGLDQAPVDPTTLDQEELVGEIQRIIKELLGMGARLPKILMLYVKNLVFLDGAIARLAPDLDIFAEITQISMYFAQTHGERLFAEVGFDPSAFEVDLTGVKDSIGLDRSVERFTYRDLQERRDLIKSRFEKRHVG